MKSTLRVVHPTCEYKTNPLGIDVQRPRLSWKLESAEPGTMQVAYQVLVASDVKLLEEGKADLWDSGKVASDRSVLVEYGGKKLRSSERAYWMVKVWDKRGNAAELAEPAWWEMGILDRKEWKGKWIGSSLVGGACTTSPAPLLRKTFEIEKKVAWARLYVTALGIYEAHINGKKVGKDWLTPGHTDYRKRVQYQAYDITESIKRGENAIGAMIGDGWYCGYVGNNVRRQGYGDRPKLLAQILVKFADGTERVIATDETWKTALGPILESDMFMGESYDARLEMPGWDMAGFDDGKWEGARTFDDPGILIVATAGPTVQAIEEIVPIAEPRVFARGWHHKAFIVDMGQNMVGTVRLKVRGPRGHTVRMRFGEMLNPDKTLYTENLRKAKQTDVYTLKGEGEEIFEPRFTFHGFRYVEVEDYPGVATKDSVTGIVLHSAMDVTGKFECSEPLINQLQHNIQWGQKGNFVDIPTDCPQRDERLGWTGDAQVFIRTAAFNMNVAGFFTKWAGDLRDSQGANGAIPSFAPHCDLPPNPNDPDWGHDGGPAWADAGVICPWVIYQHFGDQRMIEDNYEMGKKFIAFMERNSLGLIRCIPGAHKEHSRDGYGDWLSINADTPKEIIGTAFFAYSTGIVAKMAKVLGKEKDAKKYEKLAEQVRRAFIERFVTRGGLVVGQTQTAYILALHFGLLPVELRGNAVEALVRDIAGRQNRLSAGFVGSPYINHVLSDNGKLDAAYDLLMQKNWPSWLYAVTQGATTIWERWDGWTHDKGFQDAGMNSFNHYAYGAIGDWLYGVVAGIEVDPEKPGYKHIVLRPQVGKVLTHARAELESPYGKIVSGWKRDGGKFFWSIEVPANTTATAFVPGRKVKGAERGKVIGEEAGRVKVALPPGKYEISSMV